MRAKKGGNLAEYEEWLLQRQLAAEHYVGHFSRWVKRFLGLRASRPRETWQDTPTVFLEDLGDGRYKPWQVRQAGDAVTLYCGQFCEQMDTPATPKELTRTTGEACGRRSRSGPEEEREVAKGADREDGGPPGSRGSQVSRAQPASPDLDGGTPAADEDVLTHAGMLAEVRHILRLRHYAGSTERSYLGWNRRFLRYVGRSGEHLPRVTTCRPSSATWPCRATCPPPLRTRLSTRCCSCCATY